jgi:hypothetical protein
MNEAGGEGRAVGSRSRDSEYHEQFLNGSVIKIESE